MNQPSDAVLRKATQIVLARRPGTPGAEALAAALAEQVGPHLDRVRSLGAKGLPKLRSDLGTILAGLMREGLKGVPVRALRSPSGIMWERSPVGMVRFWAISEAMCRAGLVGVREGVKTPGENEDGRGGKATALWPTDVLLALAGSFGLTSDTRKQDWRSDPSQRATPPRGREAHLVRCRELTPNIPLAMTPAMAAQTEEMIADLRAINAVNGAADIRGAGHTVTLVRRFRHSLGFGGRFFAPVTNLSSEERLGVTINGSQVVEVDVKASQLTVLLGITGRSEAPQDAYSFRGLPRNVVKSWVIQSLGAGFPAVRWSRNVSAAGSGIKPKVVWEALRPSYPFLALQLRFSFHVGASCSSLVRSAPCGPSEDERWADAALREARGNAADFLERPADERASLRLMRGGVCSATALA